MTHLINLSHGCKIRIQISHNTIRDETWKGGMKMLQYQNFGGTTLRPSLSIRSSLHDA